MTTTITVSGKCAFIVRFLLWAKLVRVEVTKVSLDGKTALGVTRQLVEAMTAETPPPAGESR